MRFPLAVGVAASVALSVISGSHPASAATTSSTNWTQWGFNAQHTGDNPAETVLTRANVSHLVSVFSTRLNGTFPDPIVAGGVVYLSDSNGVVEAINGATGAVKWRTTPACAGQVTSDPAFAGGRVWIGLEDPGVAAISAGGNNVSCIESFLVSSPPSAAHGTVYAAGEGGEVAAINATTGEVRWSRQLPNDNGPYFEDSPSLSADGSAVFVSGTNSSTKGVVYKVNAATGAVIWSRTVDACASLNSTVAVSGSRLFVVSGCNLYGLSAATGSTIWQNTGVGSGDLAVAGDLVFNGAAAFNATNGTLVWNNPTYSGSSPAVANGVVYVDAGSQIFMLNSSTGAVLGVLTPSSGTQFAGAVIPVDGHVYVCTVNQSTGVASLHAYQP